MKFKKQKKVVFQDKVAKKITFLIKNLNRLELMRKQIRIILKVSNKIKNWFKEIKVIYLRAQTFNLIISPKAKEKIKYLINI